MKHMIWNNDICAEFDALVKENVVEHLSEDEIWAEAAENINENLLCEVANLNIATNSLVAVGKISRWNGTYHVYKELKARNIGRAITEVLHSFSGDNTFEVYVDGESLMISQLGHDNPTNPSIIEIREGTVEDNTPVGEFASAVYGWTEEESMSA